MISHRNRNFFTGAVHQDVICDVYDSQSRQCRKHLTLEDFLIQVFSRMGAAANDIGQKAFLGSCGGTRLSRNGCARNFYMCAEVTHACQPSGHRRWKAWILHRQESLGSRSWRWIKLYVFNQRVLLLHGESRSLDIISSRIVSPVVSRAYL